MINRLSTLKFLLPPKMFFNSIFVIAPYLLILVKVLHAALLLSLFQLKRFREGSLGHWPRDRVYIIFLSLLLH